MLLDDPRRVEIMLENSTGQHKFQYRIPQLNALISNLIETLRKTPAPLALTETVELASHPIRPDGMSIEPDPHVKENAVLVLKAGELVLPFSVPIADLLHHLERLNDMTTTVRSTHRGH